MINASYPEVTINKKVLYLAFLVHLAFSLEAATYYVSTTGNDTAGNGSVNSPWRTITKGQSMLSPGDTLYVRGGTYYESVTITVQGTYGNPVTIRAYPGETPVLDGRSIITGWTQCTANEPGLTVAGKTNINAASIYKVTIDTSNLITSELWRMLYEDGTHSFLCRWPEQSQGYGLDPEEFQDVPNESVGTLASLKDNTFLNPNTTDTIWYPYIKDLTATQLQSYWNGSYIQIWFKSGGNTTGYYSITGYDDNEIFTGTLKRELLSDDKYCFCRHPHLVNKSGKFYFAPRVGNNQTCYFWPRNTANLTNKITLATKSKGIYASNRDYVVIDGLKVVGFEDVGIHFINSTSTHPIIKNCIVEDCGKSGIYIQNAADVVIDTCTVNRVGDRGIFVNGGIDCVIKNSTTRDNRGTCISMYVVDNGQIIDNTIYDARGVHVNGVSCYLGCKKILIARNRFDVGVNLAMQNISDVCIFANIMDGGGEKNNLLSTWVDTTNSDYATRGYQVYLQNTLINAAIPYSMIDFCAHSGSFTDATIDNNGGKVRLNAAGQFTSSQFKYTGTYGLMIYCDFSDSTYADGWYESIANTADTCTIDLTYVSATPTVTGQCGGQSNNYLHNNLIGGCAEWEMNMLGRSHNWWIPMTYGGTYEIPDPPLEGEIYTLYTNRISALNSCFTDWANQFYALQTGSAAIGTGMSQTAINAILNDATIGVSGTSIRQNFPDFDFTKDITGNSWAASPSMGAYEYDPGSSAPQLPTVQTVAATDISYSSATLNAAIVSDGNSVIDQMRFDWGTTESCSDGWTTGTLSPADTFSYTLTGLDLSTPYYFMASAHNIAGWNSGEILSFNTDSILYVDQSATGSNNGIQWTDAYTDLQEVLARAAEPDCEENYTIYVAQGTYNPGNYVYSCFTLPEENSIYGGFRSGGCDFADRNPALYKTILSGAGRNRTVIMMGDNSLLNGVAVTDSFEYGIYGANANFLLDHCTVTEHEGFGIYAENATPVIKNCIVSNSAQGIKILNPIEPPIIFNSTIVMNNDYGVSFSDNHNSEGDPNYLDYPDIQNCIVYYNSGVQVAGFNPDMVAAYCCIQDCNEPQGTTNINDAPQFAYADANNIPVKGNYHLVYNSPCKDMGNPNHNNDNFGFFDMDQLDRIVNYCVDMGADEIDCEDVSNPLDWNADGLINLYEFSKFSAAWLSHDPNDPAWLANPNLVDPNLVGGWYEWKYLCNLDTTEDSQYEIDLADLIAFFEDDPQVWLWTACWKQSQFEEYGMSGGGESMQMAEEWLTQE